MAHGTVVPASVDPFYVVACMTGNTSGYTQIQPSATAGSWTMTLPSDAGTNGYVLSTNGSGVTSWVASSSGDITDVVAGAGLIGGASSGSATIDIGAGTGIVVNTNDIAVDVGTADGKIVQVQTGGKLPALDGSNLTGLTASQIPNLDAAKITTGTLGVANGGTGAATLGSGNLLVGNGTGAVTSLASGVIGNVIYGSGVATWSSGSPDTAGLVDKSSTQTITGAKAFSSNLQMNGANEIRFADADSDHYVGLKSPATVATDKIWVLSAADGATDQVLKTDGAGNLGWVTALTSGTGFVQGGNSFGATAVLGTNDNNNLEIETNGTTKMTVLANGNVGIGTTTPGSRLDVNESTASNAIPLYVSNYSSGANAGSGMVLQTPNTSTLASRNWAIATNMTANGNLEIVPSASANSFPSFNPSNIGLAITSSRNVGIATNAPGAQLQVNSSAVGSIGQIIKWGQAGQTANLLEFQNNTGTILSRVDKDGKFYGDGSGLTGITATPAGSTGEIQFNSGSSTMAADSNFNWDNTNKRLGIGTASPSAPITVKAAANGNTLFSVQNTLGQEVARIRNSGSGTYEGSFAVLTGSGTIKAFMSANAAGSPAMYANALSTNKGDGTGDVYGAALNIVSPYVVNQENGIFFSNTDTTSNPPGGAITFYTSSTTGYGKGGLKFKTSDSGSVTTRMTIDPTGNVGIGSTVPGYKLDVAGDVKASGRIMGSVATDGDALSALTIDFATANTIRATGASNPCGTLNVTNTVAGTQYTLTILNATATCSTINWGGSPTNVKLPSGYNGGVSVDGLVYSFLDDGATLWVSVVPF